jgi:pyrroloquinoline-quinone synthase
MTQAAMPEALMSLVDAVLEDVDYKENPYFRALRDGSFTREDFLETQLQFHSAVVFFNRPMAALAAKIPDPRLRVEIVRNVWEEHGEGDPSRMHGATFERFLGRLSGWTTEQVKAELDRRLFWPEVRVFNTVLVGACVLDDHLVGVGTMGIVERMFAEISSWIGRAVVDRGFMSAEQMIHYDLHERLDVKHAADFFMVCGASWDEGERARYRIEQGLRMGAVAFDQLYARLYRCRARRWARESEA